jgi:HK97 family phage prohead protease
MAKVYDPVKAHEYYERTKKLTGREGGAGWHDNVLKKLSKAPSNGTDRPSSSGETDATRAKVVRLKAAVSKLQSALSEANAALSKKRLEARKTEKESSDDKSTAKEKQASKEYRDKHKQEIASKRKKETSSGGGESSSSSSTSVSDMTVDELETRVSNIKSALAKAKQQLSDASKQLAHSDLSSESMLQRTLDSIPIIRKDSVKMTVSDFSGYATRNNLRCSDGRTILADAFSDNDGQIVPLVWQHGHDEVTNVLGHVKLENRGDGVYCHAFFNETAQGQQAKELVRHGDIKFLSIFANQLVEKLKDRVNNLKDVVKGNIREVSLVLGGANPGAFIDNVNIVHGDGEFTVLTEEAVITTGMEIELDEIEHAASDDNETLQDVIDSMSEKQKNVLYYMVGQAMESSAVSHSDTEGSTEGEVEEGEEGEPEVVEADEGESEADEGDSEEGNESEGSTDDTDEAGDAVQHANTNQEDNSMTHNVFDQARKGQTTHQQITLSHADVQGIVASAMKGGSLKDAVEDYVLQHGIENIDYLFPDAKNLESSPAFISRRMEWVDKVLGSVRKSPFSRIKTITADITPDEARARGYIKGNMKNEEYFALAKRETTPQTVYKKQKLDRDDVIDIVDLDVVAWLKAEMKVMLDEEIAGAILIGDGRSAGDDDKIKEINIRPIASDAELYVTTINVNLGDASSSIEELVDSAIEGRQYYKGTGQPTFYTTEGTISKFLTVKDNFGRRIYSNLQEVAAVLRVSDVVPVEVMERVPDVAGIMVNLADYTLGADRGGQATMFDDFDIDYNKLRYLIETRVSGALTQPKSALVFRTRAASDVEIPEPQAPSRTGNVVTVPTVTGVTYKDGGGNTLTTASPITLTATGPGSTLKVVATAAAGKFFPTNAEDEWTYEYEA